MEQQPAAATERSSRPLVRLPHSTRSFSRSRSRSPSRDDDDDANGQSLSGVFVDRVVCSSTAVFVHETEPTRWAALSPSERRELAIVRWTAVGAVDDLKGWDPVELLGDRGKIVAYMTPAYLIYVATDFDITFPVDGEFYLPQLISLMAHVFPGGIELDAHLNLSAVASLAGPETMDVYSLNKLIRYGLDQFTDYRASMSEKASEEWRLDIQAFALLRIHAMAFQNVGFKPSLSNDDCYIRHRFDRSWDPEVLAFICDKTLRTGPLHVFVHTFYLRRMIRLVKEFLQPRRGFTLFLANGRINGQGQMYADRDFINFLHTFMLNVQLIADRKLDEFDYYAFEHETTQAMWHHERVSEIWRSIKGLPELGFNEKLHYVHQKHVITLGELLQEFFQLATYRPFEPKYYRLDQDERKLAVAAPSEPGESEEVARPRTQPASVTSSVPPP